MSSHAPTQDLVYPEDKQFGIAGPGKIGMWIFLVTDAMAFSGLLIAYAILRATKSYDIYTNL
jgi:cytochrome c oxidase subunit III